MYFVRVFQIEVRPGRGSFHEMFKCNRKVDRVTVLSTPAAPRPIHIACKSTTLEKRYLVVSTDDETFAKIVNQDIQWYH